MGHTYTQLHYHCVYSTRGRQTTIFDEYRPRIHAYVGGIIRNIEGCPITIGGTRDHIHVLCTLPADYAVAKAIGTMKSNSSGWIHEQLPDLRGFAWQEGYGAFTVSRSNVDQVARYIQEQEEHHKTMTFEQEFIRLLKKHGIEYDPQYVWG